MADVGLKQRREQSVVLGVITADSMIYNSEKFVRRIFRKGNSLKSDIKFFQLLYLHQCLVTLVLSVTTCSLTSYCVVLTMAMATKNWTVLLSGINVGERKWAFTQIITFKIKTIKAGREINLHTSKDMK